MSRSSRVRLTRCDTRETVYGVPEDDSHTKVRRTDGRGDRTTTAEPSAAVRDDLQTDDVQRLDIDASLSIQDEWVFEAHEREIEEALGSTFQTPLAIDSVAADVSAEAAGNIISSTTTDKFNLVEPGQHIRLFGFPLNDNPILRVVSRTTGANPEMVVAGAVLVNETPAGTDGMIRGSYIREGTTRHLATFEEFYADLSTEFWSYAGAVCRQFTYGFAHPGRMTCGFEYACKDAAHALVTVGDGTVNEYTTNRSMNSADHFGSILEGGVALTPKVKGLNITIARGVTKIDGAGSLGALDMGIDSYNMTGELSIRNDAAGALIAEKHLNFTPSSLEWLATDPDGNVYAFFLSRIFYSGGTPGTGPKDSDVMIDLPFTLARHPTLLFMFQITKLPATA